MTPLRQIPRLLRIAAVLVRYRLDDLVDAAHLYRPLKLVRAMSKPATNFVADVAETVAGADGRFGFHGCGERRVRRAARGARIPA